MFMLEDSQEVTIEDVRAIDTPRATDTWKPLAHRDVLDEVFRNASERGFSFDFQALVKDGKLYPSDGPSMEVPGAVCYFKLLFNPHPDLLAPEGTSYTLVGINAHDKSTSLQFIAGGQVAVCSNGMRVGDIVVKRKHTSGIDVTGHVDAVFAKFVESTRQMPEMIKALQAQPLTDEQALIKIVDAADNGAISSQHIMPVVKEWREPSHADFRPRTGWSLYNAHTEVMKRQSLSRQQTGFKALNEVLYPTIEMAA
jgi:hypothetical protein